MNTEQITEVAVFGGAFNPPTLAHQEIIQACLDHPQFDEVWVMPSGERSDKADMLQAGARLAMLEAMKDDVFAGDDRLQVTDFEIALPGETETIKTVEALQTAYKGVRFWMVYGADTYERMPTWRGGEELRRTLPMLVMPREGYAMPAESERVRHLPLIDPAMLAMSSTLVREAVAEQEPFGHMVCKAVGEYMRTWSLYAEVGGLA